MKIMSFNVLCAGRGDYEWKKRIPLVLKTIIDEAPDTLGVQEAHHGWMLALQGGLPDYDCVGVGREDGKTQGEYAAIFYKRDKYTLLETDSFWLSETPTVPSLGWDAACIRICTYAVLQEKATGKKFIHLNTHLDHLGQVAMQKGAALAAARANALYPAVPALFTGDFNVTPDSVACQAVKAGGFADARDVAPVTDHGVTFHGYGNEAPMTIDYVFVKGGVQVARFAVLRNVVAGMAPSDHYPVVAEVSF